MLATHYDIVSVDSVPSTQDMALRVLEATGTPTLLVAVHQTQGRGRQGRSWDEPTRGLFSSLACEINWPLADRAVITLCTAVALAAAIEEVAGVSCDVKWPNDLFIGEAKVAGILVEATGDSVTVGCGVNLWWPDAPVGVGAIFDGDPGKDVALRLARGWVDRLLGILETGPNAWPHAEYLRRSSTVGREVVWETGRGMAIGIAPGGGLVVDADGGEIVLTAGEVHTRQGR